MDAIFSFIQNHAGSAHWVIFTLLMLAGFNFPISEDLVIISSAVIASTVIPENTWKIFMAIFLGAYISDCVVFFLGYRYGHNLWKMAFFSKMIHSKRLAQIKDYYKRFGILTLLIGRFIPFGVRNCLFLTAGIGKMAPLKFILSDALACLISNSTLFSLAYFVGLKSPALRQHITYVKIFLFLGIAIAVIAIIWYKRAKKQSAPKKD
jgi:membrane-associated protein